MTMSAEDRKSAFEKGRVAAIEGKHHILCPYDDDDWEATWLSGYQAAMMEYQPPSIPNRPIRR